MKPALGPQWKVSLGDGRARVIRKTDGIPVAALSAGDAAVLGLMNGKRDLTILAQILVQAGGAKAADALDHLVTRLGPLLVDSLDRELLFDHQDLETVVFPDPDEGFRTLPGPRTLQWLVTRYCPRKCRYCYAAPLHGSTAPDATLARDRLRELFAEAVELGAHTLMVTGGEPLLRPDLPEVLGDAIAAGIAPTLTTKYPITRPLAERLANAGLRGIGLSLDSLDPDQNQRLIGQRDYADCVRRSIANLRKAGIAYGIQAVATRSTLSGLAALSRFCAGGGAQVLLVSAFQTTGLNARQSGGDALLPVDRQQLTERIDSLAAQFSPLRIELFEPYRASEADHAHCEIGISKLFFLPDGRIHRCYRLASDQSFAGPDLSTASLASCWYDAGFAAALSPPRSAYAGTQCHGCEQFDDCRRKGRCVFRALLNHGVHAAKDRDCNGPFPR
jgi:radical SAM protein with 4Fe4S-binding SPASM domain